MRYCPFIFKTERFKTRVVKVGAVEVGGNNPVRIQSMTTTDTRDAQKTAQQIMKLADFGCEIARVTVQGMKEAYSCEEIKSILIQKGYNIPLVADIHFFPKAAMTVADFVDKVRINPGNFVDKRASFKVLEYDDQSYQDELDRLEEKFSPLVEKCKRLKIAMRIGTNHGSLSDRVMNRFGDSPQGMVEAAFEFTRVCRKLDYHDIIYSMKASNTHVMIQAYRLLVMRMMELGWDYPLHLGVTEAGSGADGRIKSAVGIGSLLLDGLGDTIRVSLTEDPWHEIDPCKRLVRLAEQYENLQGSLPFVEKLRNPLQYLKKESLIAKKPLHIDGSVFVSVNEKDILGDSFYRDLGFEEKSQKPIKEHASVDSLWIEEKISDAKALEKLRELREIGIGLFSIEHQELSTHSFELITSEDDNWQEKVCQSVDVLFIKPGDDKVHFVREVVEYLKQNKIKTPLILIGKYSQELDDICIHMGSELGSLLCDGLADGLMLQAKKLSLLQRKEMAFNLLQACRLRSSKTEFISCPSCGRTLFELQSVTKKIQERTAHLPGVKIAIMGCIVNGPGEMADADFGYVGSKPNKIDLYVGKECVEKDIDHEDAVDRLIDLLKKHNRWVEPKELQEVH